VNTSLAVTAFKLLYSFITEREQDRELSITTARNP